MIDGDAGRQRILGIRNPARQRRASPAAYGGVLRAERRERFGQRLVSQRLFGFVDSRARRGDGGLRRLDIFVATGIGRRLGLGLG